MISEVPMDFTLVKYNLDDDKCSIYNNFNYHDWSTLAKVSPDPNNAIIVDIPAGIVTFPEEHQSLPQIIYDVVGCDSNFGGIGVWDISIANSIEEDKQLENYLQNYYRYCYPLVNITVPSQSNSKSASFISSSMIANAESSFRDASTSTMVYMNNSIQGVSSYGALNSNKGTNVTMTTESSTRVATITSCAENKCSSIPMVTINGSTNHLNINISSTTNQVAVGSLTLTQINNSSGIKSYNCIALMVLGICVTFF